MPEIRRTDPQKEMTVLLHDRGISLPKTQSMNILHKPESRIARKSKNVFIFSSATRLSEIQKFIQTANNRHHLRALFVRQDLNCNWLPQMLNLSNVRTLNSMVLYSSPEVPKRILFGWQNGAQDNLIADAINLNNNLLVMSCAFEKFELSYNSIEALKKIPLEERDSFVISESGSYIHWEKSDVHLDLDAIRYVIDPKFRAKADRDRLFLTKNYGRAIAELRRRYGLTQTDIPGLSSRQLRRIEQGEYATLSSLEKLAKAHQMEIKGYLNELAKVINSLSLRK